MAAKPNLIECMHQSISNFRL